ncbi:hypothetical protein VTN00DRAFT_2688 [Thermoascus crustaceus]|uniref:uncharacterized protein n=1 Tax=Thermoascus crustaceus TaxID=5088 RepID=UPI00374396E3
MSDPYNSYPHHYAPPAGPGYPPSGQYYDPSYQAQPQPYGAYPQQPPTHDSNHAYQQPYQPPVPYQSPPQHGYGGGQFGAYDASNPQGNMGYYGQPPADTRGYSPSPNPHQQYPHDPNNPHHQPQGPYGEGAAPADPNAAEGERGLGSSLLGAAAGGYLGHKKNHGFLGAVGGAILGNVIGDKIKDRKHHGHHSSGHSSYGGSSYGGGKW